MGCRKGPWCLRRCSRSTAQEQEVPPRRRKPTPLPAVTSSRREGDQPRNWVRKVMTASHSVFPPTGKSIHPTAANLNCSCLRFPPRSSEHERPPRRCARPPFQPQRCRSQQQGVGAGAPLRRLRDGPARLQHYWQATGNGVYCSSITPLSRSVQSHFVFRSACVSRYPAVLRN